MNGTVKKGLIGSFVGSAAIATIYVVVLMHNAWGDERYQRKTDALKSEISILDNALDVVSIEIAFASTDQEIKKYTAIKEVYHRKKRTLTAALKEAS